MWKHNSYYLFVTICLVFIIFNSTFFVLQFYSSVAWFELNKEQINAARTVQVK